MSKLYSEIAGRSGKEKAALVEAAADQYESALEEALGDLKMEGDLVKISKRMPALVAGHFITLQEIEAILEHLNIQHRRIYRGVFRSFMATDRALTPTTAEKYAQGEPDVIEMAELVNRFALVRNKWQGLFKGLESKGYQITNIRSLRVAGLEDADMRT